MIADNILNRDFEADRPNRRWQTERTNRKIYRNRDKAGADVFDYIERF